MSRMVLILVAILLSQGCGKSGPSASSEAGSTGAAAGKGVLTADLPRVVAKTKLALPGKRKYEDAIHLSDDGKRLAVAFQNEKRESLIRVWDVVAGLQQVAEVKGYLVALSPSGKYVASGNQVTDLATKAVVATARGAVSHVFFRNDSILVTTARSYDFPKASKGRVTLWDIQKNADAGSFDIPDNRFSAALVTKRGKELWLFMSKDKFEVQCYDLDAKSLVRTIKPETDTPNLPYHQRRHLEHSHVGRGRVRGEHQQSSGCTTARPGRSSAHSPGSCGTRPRGFLPGGQLYLARPTSNDVSFGPNAYVVFDWNTGKPTVALTGHGTEKDPRAAASGDGKTVVSVTEEGELLVFDLAARS